MQYTRVNEKKKIIPEWLVILLICIVPFILIGTLYYIDENFLRKPKVYPYNFDATVAQVDCKTVGSSSSSYKYSSGYKVSSNDTVFKCKIKFVYDIKDLDPNANEEQKVFYKFLKTDEPILVGEIMSFVSRSKDSKKFKVCCPKTKTFLTYLLRSIFIILFITIILFDVIIKIIR